MRVFSLLILLITFVGFTTDTEKDSSLQLTSGKFTVKGKTSIGKFECDYKLKTKDTLFFNQEKGFAYHVPVVDFKCGNFLLNKDFRKTLKHKEFPEVYFKLLQVSPKTDEEYEFDLYLKIAGKEKTIERLTLKKEAQELTGNVDLTFSDFDLTPPKKLGGAIKIEEEIKLAILLRIEEK